MSSGGGNDKSHYHEYRENNELEAGKKKVDEGLGVRGWEHVTKVKPRVPSSVAATDGGDMDSGDGHRAKQWGYVEKSSKGASSTVAATDGGESGIEEEGLPGHSKKEEGSPREEPKNITIPKVMVQAPTTVAVTDSGYTEGEKKDGDSRAEWKNIILEERPQAPSTVAATDGGEMISGTIRCTAHPAGKSRIKTPGMIQAIGKIAYNKKNPEGDGK